MTTPFAGPNDKPDPAVSQQAADVALRNVGANYQGEDGKGYEDSADQYWCSDFLIWCWTQAKANVVGLSAASVSVYEYGQYHNTLHMDSPQVGDAVVFNYNANHKFDNGTVGPWSDHVAIVTKVDGNMIETVSGDWADKRTVQDGNEVHFARSSHVLLNAPEYPGIAGTTPGVIGMTLSGFITPVVPPTAVTAPQTPRAVATVSAPADPSFPAPAGAPIGADPTQPTGDIASGSWDGAAATPDPASPDPAAAFSNDDSGGGAPQGGTGATTQLSDAVVLSSAVRSASAGRSNQVTPADGGAGGKQMGKSGVEGAMPSTAVSPAMLFPDHVSSAANVQKSGGLPSAFDDVEVDDSTQGGAFTLDSGPDNGVVAGANQLLVAVAHPSCLHSGGQAVVTGSGSVFVGVQQSPLASHGDETADGGVIQDRTLEGIYMV